MKNFNVKPLAAAIASIGLATALAGPGLVWAEDETVEEVEEVLVTGSRIQRTENTQSRPVVTITGADLIASGAYKCCRRATRFGIELVGVFQRVFGKLCPIERLR